jgi:fatty-acyl-CoA synthase
MTIFNGPPLDTETGVGALTFGGFLEELAAKHGERDAIRYVVPGQERVIWTYQDLRRQARAVASALIAAGVSRGTRVGVLMGSRPEWLAATWGAAMAGGVAVPFNTFLETPELGQLLRHSDVAVVLCQAALLRHRYVDALLELCPEARTAQPGHIRSDRYPFLRHIVALDAERVGAVQGWEEFLVPGAGVPESVIDGIIEQTVPTEDAIIIYTSGTTALPKGVLHMHRGPMLQCWRHGYREQLISEDRVYAALPFFWTAGFAAVMGATLASGACLVITPYVDPALALRVIEEERITIVEGPLPKLAPEIQEVQKRERRDVSSVRRYRFYLTGEDPPADFRWPYNHASYGSSETFTSITALPFGARRELLDSYGSVTPGAHIRIIDPTTGDSLGPGDEGEIILKGITMMRGYVKAPPEQVFDPEGWFHTGDTGRFDDRGMLHFTGRLDNLIKTSGANVSPLEVEEALLQHPGIESVAVIGMPDSSVGEIVVACAVPLPGASLTEDSVRGFLRGSLSTYKIPRRVLFFAKGVLPVTASSKFNVTAIRELVADRLAAERDQVEKTSRSDPPDGR